MTVARVRQSPWNGRGRKSRDAVDVPARGEARDEIDVPSQGHARNDVEMPVRPRSRMPLDRLLPEETLTALRHEAAYADEITAALVTQLDRRLAISQRYGVSRRRLCNFLRRHQTRRTSSVDAQKSLPTNVGESSADWHDKVHAHRRRQQSVAAILDRTFGRWADNSPDLWERRAYLMLVGLVYERLATGDEEISTEELTKLAKALAENRRAEARRGKDTGGKETIGDAPPPPGELPQGFGEVVRRVYGTTLPSTT